MLKQSRFRTALAALALALIAAPVAVVGGMAAAEQRAATDPLALAEQDRADLQRIEQYLNRLTTLRSRFIQVNSLGAFAEGELYLDRPGQMRFEYDPPHPIVMIARGGSLLYYNKELKQASFLPVGSTPLRFLADDDISLSDNAVVTAVERKDATLSVTLVDKGAGYEGELTLVFADKPLALRKWQILDPEGVTIQVGLINPQFGVAIDGALFEYGDLDVYGFKGGK